MNIIDSKGRLTIISIGTFLESVISGLVCPLCCKSVPIDQNTEEHVIPKWIIREAALSSQSIVLPNGKALPYTRYKVPLCRDCNSALNNVYEKPVSRLVKAANATGDLTDLNTNKKLVFAWASWVFFKTHYMDKRQEWNPHHSSNEGTIAERYKWSELHHIYCIARSAFAGIRIGDSALGTIRFFNVTDNSGSLFDYLDNYPTRTLIIRVKNLAIAADLTDCGIVGEAIPSTLLDRSTVTPLQLREMFARFVHAKGHLNWNPGFRTISDNYGPVIEASHRFAPTLDEYDTAFLGELMWEYVSPVLPVEDRSDPHFKEQMLRGDLSYFDPLQS